MSEFAERVFEEFARRQKQPVLLRKGEYYLMLGNVEPAEIPEEVTKKLDRLAKHFEGIAAPRAPQAENQRKAEEVSRQGMAWLDSHREKPFFLFLHYYDPHTEYSPPPPFPSTYAGEIAYVDASIGKVMEKLRALNLSDNGIPTRDMVWMELAL